MTDAPSDAALAVVALLRERGESIAVAESLTGGLLAAALISVPGASTVMAGGVVAYQTELKHRLLYVDAELLSRRGAVDPEVARQMAEGARRRLSFAGHPAAIGLATTGVAGPDPQDGRPVGEVYLGLSIRGAVSDRRLQLAGSRDEIRRAAVEAALTWVREALHSGPADDPSAD